MNNHDYLIKKVCFTNKGIARTKAIQKYPNILDYLSNRFKDSESIKETLNRIYFGIIDRPVCKICGSKVKFVGYKNRLFKTYCCVKCSRLDPEVKAKQEYTMIERYGCAHNFSGILREHEKKTWLDKYGVDNPFAAKEIKDKIKSICLEKYNVEYYSQSQEYRGKILENWSNKSKEELQIIHNKTKETIESIPDFYNLKTEKTKNTCLKKYGVTTYTKTQEYKNRIKEHKSIINELRKQTCIEKYNTEYITQAEEFKLKRLRSLKEHNSFNKSKAQENLKDILIELYGEQNVICEYKEERYPFNCDFYIPSEDLFIELQGHMTHGGHPFDLENDMVELNRIKMLANGKNLYSKKIEVWTIKDVNKRNTAKLNNLKYLEIFEIIFNKEDIENKINNYLSLWESK